jgi:hypothetical protein
LLRVVDAVLFASLAHKCDEECIILAEQRVAIELSILFWKSSWIWNARLY